MSPTRVSAIALSSIPTINVGDDLSTAILESAKREGISLEDEDVIIIASKIVSKSEGRLVRASDVIVTEQAEEIAKRNAFDPVHVELAIRESTEILKSEGVLITETRSGLICNFSGVDKSNAPEGEYVLLPKNPDYSAEHLRMKLERETGLKLAVIISDSHGRPWRGGLVNVAIGCSGINAFKYNKGKNDLYGRVLKRSTICQIDELAAFAEPLMGQADERVPVVIVRGYRYSDGIERAVDINRAKEDDVSLLSEKEKVMGSKKSP
ncbi:MAG: coenzyme F420-0:L-glutamate ligase [Candidatus Thorarchaeota archaeon]